MSNPAKRPISIIPSTARFAEQMEDLSHLVYNSTREQPDGTLTAAHFREEMRLFPEGQFVALDAGRVVGLTASMRLSFDPAHPFSESWYDTISDGWITRHDPAAEWMYGVETCVHPDYRSMGIGGKLMEARFHVAQALNLRGMVAGSAIIDYYKVAERLSAEDYVQGVIAGTYFDTNLSKQLRKGFKAVALIPNFLDDAETLGWGVVILWENPTFDPARPALTTPITPRRYRIAPRAPRRWNTAGGE